MASFSFQQIISYLANIFLSFSQGPFCRVHPPIFKGIAHAFLLLESFAFYLRLAIVVQPRRCTSPSTYCGLIDSYKVFNCQQFYY